MCLLQHKPHIERKEHDIYAEMMRGGRGQKGMGMAALMSMLGRGFFGPGMFEEECIRFRVW